MAPFCDDINLQNGGTISYETFESGYFLEQVSAYIQRKIQNAFQGTWMMNVYYKEVAPYSESGGESGGEPDEELLGVGSGEESGQELKRVSVIYNYEHIIRKILI